MARVKPRKAKPELHIDFPQRYIVIAADFSLKRPGFCRITAEQTENELILSDIATVSVDNKRLTKPHGELLDDILKEMAFFFPEETGDVPVFYVREKAINSRAAMAEIGIFKVVGLADWFLWRINREWYEIFPVSVKKFVTGSGKADKKQVAEALKAYIGEHEYGNDDESDAAAVGIAWLIQHGQLKQRPLTEPTKDLEEKPEK